MKTTQAYTRDGEYEVSKRNTAHLAPKKLEADRRPALYYVDMRSTGTLGGLRTNVTLLSEGSGVCPASSNYLRLLNW